MKGVPVLSIGDGAVTRKFKNRKAKVRSDLGKLGENPLFFKREMIAGFQNETIQIIINSNLRCTIIFNNSYYI